LKHLLSSFFVLFLNTYTIAQNIDQTLQLQGMKATSAKVYLQALTAQQQVIFTKTYTVTAKNPNFVVPFANSKAHAIQLYLDLNNNAQIDKNLLGMPTEPWGVSNNVPARFGPPNFKKMLFVPHANTPILIQLQ
jgi:uncharacterized protein (DUF2141 family)